MMETEDCCPLCMEDLDVTDKNFLPCKCGYQICLFCYRHIKEDLNGLCPACRTPYDEANVTYVTTDPAEMAKLCKEKKVKELKDKKEREAKDKRDLEIKLRQEAQQRAAAAASAPTADRGGAAPGAGVVAGSASLNAASRQAKQPARAEPPQRDLSHLRVVQRTVVHVTGLSPRIGREEILRRQEYFGQYGKILKVLLSNAPSVTPGPPSLSCTITYASRDEAEQAILAVDGVVLDGRTLKAAFGLANHPALPSRANAAHGEADGADDARAPHDAPTPAAAAPSASREEQRERAASRDAPATAARDAAIRAPSNTAPQASWEAPALVPAVSGGSAAVNGAAGGGMRGSRDPAATPASAAPGAGAVGAIGSGAAVGSSALGRADAPVGAAGLGPTDSSADGSGGGAVDAAARSAAARRTEAVVSMLSCASGAEMTDPCAEPWSIVGGFDALEEEAPPSGGGSRFARFFKDEDPASDEGSPSMSSSPLGALGGLRLENEPAKQQDDQSWQSGFRALLPNVNISFSAFDGAAADAPAAAGGLSFGPLGGLAGLSALSSAPPTKMCANGMGGGTRPGDTTSSSSLDGGGGLGGLGSASFGGLGPAGGAAGPPLNGAGSLAGGAYPADSGSMSGSPPTSAEVSLSLLGSGPGLLGGQLPRAQLSSQLQSLLGPANGGSCLGSAAPAPGRAVGASLLAGAEAAPGQPVASTAQVAGLWGSGGSSSLMPGWLPSEGLLQSKDDGSIGGSDASQKDPPHAAGKLHKKDAGGAGGGAGGAGGAGGGGAGGGGGGGDRSKPKKRGGTGNRQKSELKGAHK